MSIIKMEDKNKNNIVYCVKYIGDDKLETRIYLNYTITKLKILKQQHRNHITNPKKNNEFVNSLRKYGFENFKYEILYESKKENVKEDLKNKITELIKKFDNN